jgi:hypothetical protein
MRSRRFSGANADSCEGETALVRREGGDEGRRGDVGDEGVAVEVALVRELAVAEGPGQVIGVIERAPSRTRTAVVLRGHIRWRPEFLHVLVERGAGGSLRPMFHTTASHRRVAGLAPAL